MRNKGFTLIEVLVVAVIVAILAAVAIPAYMTYVDNSKVQVVQNFAGTVATACGSYVGSGKDTKAAMAAAGTTLGLINARLGANYAIQGLSDADVSVKLDPPNTTGAVLVTVTPTTTGKFKGAALRLHHSNYRLI